MKKPRITPSYAAAYEELKEILAALEQGEIDVDELSAKVKRAAELIEFCQKRLSEAELEVKRVVDAFEARPAADDDDDPDDEEPVAGGK